MSRPAFVPNVLSNRISQCKRPTTCPYRPRLVMLSGSGGAFRSIVDRAGVGPSKASAPSVLIFGGGSALGCEIERMFKSAGWRVVTLDFFDQSVPCGGVNGCALPRDGSSSLSLALPTGATPRMQAGVAEKCLRSAGVKSFNAVINATLGYVTSGISDDDIWDSVDYMYRTSVESSLICSRLAYRFMAPGGMLALLGSKAALSPQPKTLGYSVCKAAIHQMVRSLALTVGDEFPPDVTVVGLVPEVLDTPLHRSMNQGQRASHWTPCDAVASKLLQWAQDPSSRPPNSSLVSISTSEDVNGASGGKHHFRLIQNPSFVQSQPL